ncbi:unnamed protein product, partial [marine sediment metagenome]
MLAHNFKPAKHNIAGWYLSEKLDGTRAFWDGGISRGFRSSNVPYANTVKDIRYLNDSIATGLWSRSGKVIHAPDWWLDGLPPCFLDGELFIGRGRFQELRKVVATLEPGPGWDDVWLRVFDSPRPEVFAQEREIKIRSEYSFWIKGAHEWVVRTVLNHSFRRVKSSWKFEEVLLFLEKILLKRALDGSIEMGNVCLLRQEKLPLSYLKAMKRIEDRMEEIADEGGEGVVLRNPVGQWSPVRSHNLLKHKPW